MDKNACFYLGYISRVVGLKGDLIFQLDVDNPQSYKKLESVFLEINKSLVPFFVKHISFKHTTAHVSLETIDSYEKAKELVGTSLYVSLTFLPELKGNQFYYHEVIGFQVNDKQHGNIGIIENILEYPQQAIFQIKQGETEILIPVKNDFITKVDRANKRIDVNTPDGLVDVYTKPDDSQEEQE